MRYLLILVFALNAHGAIWYCRPSVNTGVDGSGKPIPVAGVYGSQDGTSYANAWNGLREVVWGTGGVVAGDTLYVAGEHLHEMVSNDFLGSQAYIIIGADGTDVSPITIRMDYPDDPGEIFGCYVDSRPLLSWSGPDANGVYTQDKQSYGNVYPIYFERVGNEMVRYNRETNTTWVGNLGTSYNLSGTNYLKTLSGDAPSGNEYSLGFGYTFYLGNRSNIVFQTCRFFASEFTGNTTGYDLHCNKITFTNCVFREGSKMRLLPGWDDFTFDNCTMSFAHYGIYGFFRTGDNVIAPYGPNRITVRNCTITDMGSIDAYWNRDAHAAGSQSGSGWLVEGNTILRTGSAIEFYTGSQGMSNNIIRRNFIKDISVQARLPDVAGTSGHGIVVSGDSDTPVGQRLGFEIYDNVVINVGKNGFSTSHGFGISSNNKDATSILNNTIHGATNGVRVFVSGEPALGVIKNNLIVNTANNAITVSGTSTTGVECDYNLFYLGETTTFSPSSTHDVNSVTGDPLFVSATPSVAADYRLQSTSPAVGAGTSVGLSTDYAGRAWKNPPAIGAYEFWESMSRATNLNVGSLRGR